MAGWIYNAARVAREPIIDRRSSGARGSSRHALPAPWFDLQSASRLCKITNDEPVVNVKIREQLARAWSRIASSIKPSERGRGRGREGGREEERALPVVHLCARQYAFEPVAPGWRGRGERPTPLKRARRCDTVRLALLLASSPT